MSVLQDVPIVDVVYETVAGWHQFTSPELPELHVLVEPLDYYLGLEKVREAIETLTNAEAKGLPVRPLLRLPTCECTDDKDSEPMRPRVVRFAIGPWQPDEIDREQHRRDRIRRLERLRDAAPDAETRAVIETMIAGAERLAGA